MSIVHAKLEESSQEEGLGIRRSTEKESRVERCDAGTFTSKFDVKMQTQEVLCVRGGLAHGGCWLDEFITIYRWLSDWMGGCSKASSGYH